MTARPEKLAEVDRQNAVAVVDDEGREKSLWPREGEWVTIVTAAPIYHGRLVAITPCDYVLEDASWVVETGRLSEYVKAPDKTATEAEYVGEMAIPRGAVMAVYRVAEGAVKTR